MMEIWNKTKNSDTLALPSNNQCWTWKDKENYKILVAYFIIVNKHPLSGLTLKGASIVVWPGPIPKFCKL